MIRERWHEMGDIADYINEQGEDMWLAHINGNCFEDCIYCETEELKEGGMK